MANFEAFHWVISSSINLLFLKSDHKIEAKEKGDLSFSHPLEANISHLLSSDARSFCIFGWSFQSGRKIQKGIDQEILLFKGI